MYSNVWSKEDQALQRHFSHRITMVPGGGADREVRKFAQAGAEA